MAKPSPKDLMVEAQLERISTSLYGRSRLVCIRNDTCVMCGSAAEEFRDEESKLEFAISALCQICQDKVFGHGEAGRGSSGVRAGSAGGSRGGPAGFGASSS